LGSDTRFPPQIHWVWGTKDLLDTDPHCGSSGSFKHHKDASGNASSKHHLRVFIHTRTHCHGN